MSKPSHWRFFFLPVLCKQQPASFVIFSEHLNVVSRPVYFNFVEQMKIDFVFFYHENELPQSGFFDGQSNHTLSKSMSIKLGIFLILFQSATKPDALWHIYARLGQCFETNSVSVQKLKTIKGRFPLRTISMGSDRIGTKLNPRMGFRYQFSVPVWICDLQPGW